MAYKIDKDLCNGCAACEPECPNVAITAKSGLFVIDPAKCTECKGHFDEAQCEAVCPIDNAVVVDPDYPRYEG